MEHFAKHERNYIDAYKEKGYTDSFRFEEGRLKNLTHDLYYKADELRIEAEHCYEGMSNPSDLSILYVLESKDGHKGQLLAAYGPSADAELFDFMEQVENKDEKNKTEKS